MPASAAIRLSRTVSGPPVRNSRSAAARIASRLSSALRRRAGRPVFLFLTILSATSTDRSVSDPRTSGQGGETLALPVLWQFAFSHFNEKVRWALDWKGIPHIRRSVPPGIHFFVMRRLTGQTGTPALMLDGRIVVDSTRIIAALEQHQPEPALYPADPDLRARALALEDYFDEEVGHPLRKAVLHEVFSEPDWALALFTMDQPRWIARVFRLFGVRLLQVYRARADVNAVSAAHGRERVLAALDLIEAEVKASGFLVGDRFSVADLTAAALLYPLVVPPQFPDRRLRWPAASIRYSNTLIHRPGFQWVADMYRRYRGPATAIGPRLRSSAWLVPLLLRRAPA